MKKERNDLPMVMMVRTHMLRSKTKRKKRKINASHARSGDNSREVERVGRGARIVRQHRSGERLPNWIPRLQPCSHFIDSGNVVCSCNSCAGLP